MTTILALPARWRQQARELMPADPARHTLDQCAVELDAAIADQVREAAADATDPDAAEIAARRVDEAAARVAGRRVTPDQRRRAVAILLDLWTVWGEHGMRPVDLAYFTNTAADAVNAAILLDRRGGAR